TMVIDAGLPLELFRQYIELGSELIDYVKFGWGTSVITSDTVRKKAKVARANGVMTCFGGTFFELAYIQGKLDKLIGLTQEYGIDMLEISDGSIDISRDNKLGFIERFSGELRVLSEFGSKDAETVMAPNLWVAGMSEELEAGAWKVVAEGRESGTAGLYRQNKEIRTGLIDEVLSVIDNERIIWEAPLKAQQVWFIQNFGANVNLGNIAATDIIALETLRLGLRGDTLTQFHGNHSDSIR
ncbi:MAG: phosphosulfolactate synthase, partial [Pseudomonadota bacterium]